MRLDEELLRRVDKRAEALRWSRNTFLVWAAENALEDAKGGVPDLAPAVASAAGQAERSVPTPQSSPRAPVIERELKPMSDAELRAWKRGQTGGGSRGVA